MHKKWILAGVAALVLRRGGLQVASLVMAHLVILAFEHLLSPSPTRHHELATFLCDCVVKAE